MLNPLDLTNRVYLVTGGSSGIGRDTAILLSELGARVCLVARNRDRLSDTVHSMVGSGHTSIPFDLHNVDDIPQLLKRVAQEMGPLNGFVHSAGIQITMPLRVLNDRNLRDVLTVNLNAGVALAKGFRQKGVFSGDSSVVFLSSVMGLVGQPAVSAYAASKGAIIALTKSLALELARDGIRVNCVAPGHVHSEMSAAFSSSLTADQMDSIRRLHPLGFGTARDVSHAIAFLLADTGRWITGTTLVVDGGYTAH